MHMQGNEQRKISLQMFSIVVIQYPLVFRCLKKESCFTFPLGQEGRDSHSDRADPGLSRAAPHYFRPFLESIFINLGVIHFHTWWGRWDQINECVCMCDV